MSRDSYQQQLPPELTIVGDELIGSGAFGRVFVVLDGRFNPHTPVKRVVRFLEASPDAAWPEHYRQRVAELLATRLPHVGAPREAGRLADGTIYTLCDYLGEPLTSKIQIDKGVDPGTAAQILEQLLTGLASLHRRNIAHGDLRPRNVFLAANGTNGRELTAWIADPSIGGLTSWSKGLLRDAESCKYHPPEWDAKTLEPSFKGDLYALGLLTCELLLGSAANPAQQTAGPSASTVWEHVQPKLKDKKVGSALLKTIQLLVADDARRPTDAAQALACFHNAMQWQSWSPWRIGLGVSIGLLWLLLFVVGALWRGAESEIKRQEATIAEVKKEKKNDEHEELGRIISERDGLVITNQELVNDNKRMGSELAQTKKDLEKAHQEIADLTKSPPRAPMPDAVELAKAEWNKQTLVKSFNGVIDQLQKLYEKELKTRKEVAAEFKKWRDALNKLALSRKTWPRTDEDKDLQAKLDKVCRTPWDPVAMADSNDYITAVDLWVKWADSSLSIENIRAEIELQQSENVKQTLGKWLSQFNAKPTWTIRFNNGTAQTGDGTTRRLSVTQPTASSSGLHTWTTATLHNYAVAPASRDIKFNWSLGQPFAIAMEGGRSWVVYRFYLLSPREFPGPLALWRANQIGTVDEKDTAGTVTRSLVFEILNCPGPPQGWYTPTAKTLPIPGAK